MEIDHELVVGREGADLTISDPEMSRRHAVLRPVEEGVEVEDLESLNGTRVDGRLITAPFVLSATGTVVVGKTELRIELELPGATRLTPPRGADVTAPRRAPLVSPETAVRPKGRERPGSAAPAAVEAERKAAAPAPVRAERPPAPPPAAPASPATGGPDGSPRRTRGTTIALGIAGLVVATAVALLALANTGGSSSRHGLDATLRAGIVNRSPSTLLLAGVEGGDAAGEGAVTLDIAFRSGNALSLRSPSRFSARVVQRFDGGSLTSIVDGTATPAAGGGVGYTGTGQFTDGSRDYHGASGRYRLQGTIDAQGTGVLRLTGTVDY